MPMMGWTVHILQVKFSWTSLSPISSRFSTSSLTSFLMKGIRALTLSSTKVEIDSAINLLKTLKLSFLLGAYSTFLGTEGTLVSLTSAAFFYFASFIAAAFLSFSSSLACLCFSFSSCIAIFFRLCSSWSWAFFYALSLAFFCSSSSLFCFCSFLTCSLSSFLGFSGLSWSWGLFNFFLREFLLLFQSSLYKDRRQSQCIALSQKFLRVKDQN